MSADPNGYHEPPSFEKDAGWGRVNLAVITVSMLAAGLVYAAASRRPRRDEDEIVPRDGDERPAGPSSAVAVADDKHEKLLAEVVWMKSERNKTDGLMAEFRKGSAAGDGLVVAWMNAVSGRRHLTNATEALARVARNFDMLNNHIDGLQSATNN